MAYSYYLQHHCFPSAISTVSFCYRKKEKNVAPFVPLHKNPSDSKAFVAFNGQQSAT
jgi:hypothetical protein